MFENLNISTDLVEKDVLGGGGMPEAGAFEAAVDLAYVETSSGGATGLVLKLNTADGKIINNTLWMVSGNAKGNKNFYLDRSGNEVPLPGWAAADSLCQLALGKSITAVKTETREVPVYNFDAKKEIPTQKQVLTELSGKKVIVGVIKERVNKQAKNADGIYVDTAETREQLVIDKFFESGTGRTTVEKKAGLDKGEFITAWIAKNAGQVRDRTRPVEGAASPAAAPGLTTPLFS